jgi:hypothetical protein
MVPQLSGFGNVATGLVAIADGQVVERVAMSGFAEVLG